mmetsp:Transcript_91856/g.159332  ORF Transcript_91856/g.159332 Transcript_91856/m.159332 type:complete len:311 (-) Transcript_91856:51-983(-)
MALTPRTMRRNRTAWRMARILGPERPAPQPTPSPPLCIGWRAAGSRKSLTCKWLGVSGSGEVACSPRHTDQKALSGAHCCPSATTKQEPPCRWCSDRWQRCHQAACAGFQVRNHRHGAPEYTAPSPGIPHGGRQGPSPFRSPPPLHPTTHPFCVASRCPERSWAALGKSLLGPPPSDHANSTPSLVGTPVAQGGSLWSPVRRSGPREPSPRAGRSGPVPKSIPLGRCTCRPQGAVPASARPRPRGGVRPCRVGGGGPVHPLWPPIPCPVPGHATKPSPCIHRPSAYTIPAENFAGGPAPPRYAVDRYRRG